MEKGKIGGIRTPKPLNRLSQNLAWVIMSTIWTTKPKFKSIAPVGESRQMGEISLTWFLADVNSRSRSLYAIADPSVVCLSSVTLVRPTQPVESFGNFFSPYDSPGTLVFWCQNSLLGDAPFPLKFSFKVTHPLSNSAISTNIGS